MKRNKGFTLIELLVVIAIIGILASVVLASLTNAKKSARDAARISELKQIQTALNLYRNANGHWPREASPDNANGIIGEGAGLDTLLAPYMPNIPHDPMGPGHLSYRYYYDGRQSCDGELVVAIAAVNLEAGPGNKTELCAGSWGGEGGIGKNSSYNIVIGKSDG